MLHAVVGARREKEVDVSEMGPRGMKKGGMPKLSGGWSCCCCLFFSQISTNNSGRSAPSAPPAPTIASNFRAQISLSDRALEAELTVPADAASFEV